ncbi:MAG: hypothetical protein PHG13_00180 [Candidatus Pacebacteria bacterium]|nr:hypothetical protein [Candidatus Paceibacterota bacterium]MDD5721658.1 hypothetical protein [Candidatus Paceibacterota bacterium]
MKGNQKDRRKKIILIIGFIVILFLAIDYVTWKASLRWKVVDANLPVISFDNVVCVGPSFDIEDPIHSPAQRFEYSYLRLGGFKIHYPKNQGGGYVHHWILDRLYKTKNIRVTYRGFEQVPNIEITVRFVDKNVEILTPNKLYVYKGYIKLQLFNNGGRLLAEKEIKINVDNGPIKVSEIEKITGF